MMANHQAYQAKAMMAGAEFNRGNYRKPGSMPVAPAGSTSALCFR
jgi:hypothetical protein